MADTTRRINPYFDYTVVRDPAMFFGRDDELSELYEAGYRKQSISLVGRRHIGKSSLFKYMSLPQVQTQYEQHFHYKLCNPIFILIDLRDYLQKGSEDFFAAVSERIHEHVRPLNADIRLPTRKGADQLSELLEQIEKANLHPVLLMDSFDRVTSNAHFGPDFFSFLRSLATRGHVSYITASNRQLYEMSHQEILTSPFFDIFTTCKIGPLTKESARELITVPVERVNSSFTPEEVEWILYQAGRHPFFLQVTCRYLFDEKWRGEHAGGHAIDLNHVQERIYGELLPHFEKVWNDLSPEQQRMLKQEVVTRTHETRELAELSESQLFRRYLYEQFNVDQLDITLKDVRDALDSLDDREALANSKLSEMHYIIKLYKQEGTPTYQKKGTLVYDLLKRAFEQLRAGGVRSDAALEWRMYNILYYRYFRYHLPNEKTAARLGIGSKRQYYREQEKALSALLDVLKEIEAASLSEGIVRK